MMLFLITATIFFAQFALLLEAKAPSSQSVSMSVTKDIDGRDLNFKGLDSTLSLPFKIDDSLIMGFRCKLGNLKNLLPDSLFAEKTIGATTIGADCSTNGKRKLISASWASKTLGFFFTEFDHMKCKVVTFRKGKRINNLPVVLQADYMPGDQLTGEISVDVGDTSIEASYGTKKKQLEVVLRQQLDEQNTLMSSVNLKTGEMMYQWVRRYGDGLLDTTLYPGDQLLIKWVDRARAGSWTTLARIPIISAATPEGSKTSITVRRDWKY